MLKGGTKINNQANTYEVHTQRARTHTPSGPLSARPGPNIVRAVVAIARVRHKDIHTTLPKQ